MTPKEQISALKTMYSRLERTWPALYDLYHMATRFGTSTDVPQSVQDCLEAIKGCCKPFKDKEAKTEPSLTDFEYAVSCCRLALDSTIAQLDPAWEQGTKYEQLRKGGKREGAGRKPLPDNLKKKQRQIYVTDADFEKVEGFIRSLR